MKVSSLCIAVGLAWFISLGLASASPEGTPSLPNAMCPVTPDEPAEKEFWSEHAGTRVYFCCPKCRRKFEADPSAYPVERANPILPEADHGNSHDHQHHSSEPKSDFLDLLGKLHPISVHFPIALFIMAGVCEAAFGFTKRTLLHHYAGFNLLIGWLFGILASILGWINAASGGGDTSDLVSQHRLSAIALIVIAGICMVIWPWNLQNVKASKNRILLARILLSLVVALTVVTGHLGGSLVFGENYLPW